MIAAFEAERIDTRASEDQKVWKWGDRLVLRPSNSGMTIERFTQNQPMPDYYCQEEAHHTFQPKACRARKQR